MSGGGASCCTDVGEWLNPMTMQEEGHWFATMKMECLDDGHKCAHHEYQQQQHQLRPLIYHQHYDHRTRSRQHCVWLWCGWMVKVFPDQCGLFSEECAGLVGCVCVCVCFGTIAP